jgi:hypothetical protein
MIRSQLVTELEQAKAEIIEIEQNSKFSAEYKEHQTALLAAFIANCELEIAEYDMLTNQQH